MKTTRTLSDDQIRRVIMLRDERGMVFHDIDIAMDWSRRGRASDIYHYYIGRELTGEAKLRTGGAAVDDGSSPIGGPGKVPDRVHPDAAGPAKLAASPGAKRFVASSIPDDIVLRIQKQGLTAGLFGDPPPGRSALDQKCGAAS